MTCTPLPDTGLDANVGLLLLLAIALVTSGALVLLLARRARSASATLVILMLFTALTTIATMGIPAPAQAAASGCTSSDNLLTVTQTSTMVGLAPGVAGVPITGRLENNSQDSTHVTAVDVEITGITPMPGAPAGSCDASDYRLSAPRMRVEKTLTPGGSTPFTGATLGFANKPSNQDACQRAVIHLLYTANPH